MKITIITATFNSEKTLEDTIRSVLMQSHRDIEYIIIDGASTDGTLDIIRRFEPSFGGKMIWRSEPDKGIYDAMNKGIALATGDIVGMLNSDDFFYDVHVLERMVAAFEESDIDCVFGDLLIVEKDDTDRVTRVWKGSPYHPGLFQTGWQPAHPTFYCKRSVFQRMGNFRLDYPISADFELMHRFLTHGDIRSRYLSGYFVKMRKDGSSNRVANIIRGNWNILRTLYADGYYAGPVYLMRRLIPKALEVVKRKLFLTQLSKIFIRWKN